MPTKKYEWKPVDKAAQLIISRLVAKSGLGYTGLERASDGQIGYNRIRDLSLGLKAPARLSEFILICLLCKTDPIEILKEIIKTGDEIKSESISDDILKSFSNGDDKAFGLAADVEQDKWREAEGGDGR